MVKKKSKYRHITINKKKYYFYSTNLKKLMSKNYWMKKNWLN